jgi:hypothetical protein
MFKVNSLDIPFEMIAKSKTCLCVGVVPWYDYADNKRTDKQLGFTYQCVLAKNGFQEIRIKVEEAKPSVTQDVLEAAGGAVEVETIGFAGKIYVSNGRAELSAKASAVSPVRKAQ